MCDVRRLRRLRIWGLLPILQWQSSLERPETQPQDRRLLAIERLQVLSMLAYYPLEHLCTFIPVRALIFVSKLLCGILLAIYAGADYLGSHSVVRISPGRLNKLGLWSCRFWAAYVLLQFFHLAEDNNMLAATERAIRLKRRALDARQVGPQFSGEKGKERALEDDVEGEREGEDMGERSLRMEEAALRTKKDALLTETVVNLGYAPLTIHW